MPDRHSHGLVQRDGRRETPPAVPVHTARSRHPTAHNANRSHINDCGHRCNKDAAGHQVFAGHRPTDHHHAQADGDHGHEDKADAAPNTDATANHAASRTNYGGNHHHRSRDTNWQQSLYDQRHPNWVGHKESVQKHARRVRSVHQEGQ